MEVEELYKNQPNTDTGLPKLWQTHMNVYTSKKMMKQLNLKKWCKKYNKEGRIARKIKFETLELNMALIINYLSHHCPMRWNNKPRQISSKIFKKVASERYYRLCIDILKDAKLLYIETWHDGVETYQDGVRSKGYRWNIGSGYFSDDDIKIIKSYDSQQIRKIVADYKTLQCHAYFKDRMHKKVITVGGSKKFKIKKHPQTRKDVCENIAWVNTAQNVEIYVHQGFINKLNNWYKYGLVGKFISKFHITFAKGCYSAVSFEELQKIYNEYEELSYNVPCGLELKPHENTEDKKLLFDWFFDEKYKKYFRILPESCVKIQMSWRKLKSRGYNKETVNGFTGIMEELVV